MMKTLVVYYSRTGLTKKAAEALAPLLEADLEEIREAHGRGGPLGWVRSGREASQGLVVPIESTRDPSSYGLVVIGTPIWAWTVSSPVRSYLNLMRDKLPQVAFFCTLDGNVGKTFEIMAELSGKKPIATAEILSSEVKGEDFLEKIKAFADSIRRVST